ncbi:MAG: NAD(P)-dependent oxidoreductase, partial [Planctomycetaceae bacterium]|nr:NAD(P)-dependent oxidoreductase [Planctomycetaceae bacterium]
MRILLTGITGFLGRQLAPMLGDHELFAISRGSHKSGFQPDNINWIEADLSQHLDPAILPASMDAIIHLAQSDHYRSFPDGAADMFKVNVEVPAILLAWAQKAGVSRFVAASTGTVYEPFTGAMTENSSVSPTGYYGASKLAAEALALAYQGVFDVCQLRVFFLYGPRQEGMM